MGYWKIRENLLTLSISNISRDTVSLQYIAEIIDQKKVESDLVLKSNDSFNYQIYEALIEEIDIILDYDPNDYSEMDLEYISKIISLHIFECLYSVDYHYRFNCLLGDSYLFLEQQWKYALTQTLSDYDMEEIDYFCDLCRKRINNFENAYHCDYGHDFCIACIHSILTQYNQMKPFLMKLLQDILTDACIDEIVTF